MPEHHLRFAVRSQDGSTSDIWKCWTIAGNGKRDVYLTSRPLGQSLKLSLHEGGRWHVGFHAHKKDEIFSSDSMPTSRFLGAWERPDANSAPWVLAARVHFPWSSPSSPARNASEDICWITCAPKGKMVEVAIFLINVPIAISDWPGKRAMNTGLVGRIPLDGGGEVVIVSRIVEMPSDSSTKSGLPNYFRGRTKEDLYEANRMVTWGVSPDGSVSFMECKLVVENDRIA